MVIGGKDGSKTWRYATWEEAEAGHVAALAKIK